jgi:hypothetical protein
MISHPLIKILCLGCALCLCLPLPCCASQPVPPFAFGDSFAPDAAPNPPYIIISPSGSNAVRLEWSHPEASLTSYEVWRSESPYFDQAIGPAAKIGAYQFAQGVYGENVAFEYLDDGFCSCFAVAGQSLPCAVQNPSVTVIGDVDHQYYWLVRASNGVFADSNRVGEFDFPLVRGP